MGGSSMGREVLVRAESLSRLFGAGLGAVSAVAEATFTIQSADRIALVGPSGSGKSTLLHLLAGLDRQTGGQIEWPALGPPESLRPGPVAMAFQGPSLLPPLTELENVALPVLLSGGSEEDAVAEARGLLAVFEVTQVAEKLPEELSGGQSQRVGLARAFSGSPRLRVADEPTGQQDPATGARLMDAILTIADQEGAALVIATHDRSIAERLPTRWSIQDGRLRTQVVPCSA